MNWISCHLSQRFHFYITDHLGSVRAILDVDGNIKSTHDFEPFGFELQPLSAESTNFKYKYTGQERDYSTNLDYMHFRYYASTMGRFLKPDNIIPNAANPRSWNLYSYVNGNPVNFNDPSGHIFLSSSMMNYLSNTFGIGFKDSSSNSTSAVGQISSSGGGGGGDTSTTGGTPSPGDANFIGPTLPGPGDPNFIGAPETPYIVFDGRWLTFFDFGGKTTSFEARSGELNGEGQTQPQLQDKENVGPIPEGTWSFNTKDIQHWSDLSIWQKVASYLKRGEWPGGIIAWGEERVWLEPISYTGPRTAFSIHGGYEFGSRGCIDLATNGSAFFSILPKRPTLIIVFVNYP